MKQTKRILSLLLTLALVSSLFSFNTYAATVKISKTKLELEVGSSAALKVTGTKSKVTWKSSNTKIATVSATGKVTGVKKGSANITATVDKKSYSCKLTVKDVEYVTVTVTDMISGDIGDYVNKINFKKKVNNDNYTTTYTMTKKQQKDILEFYKDSFINNNVSDYPSFCTSIVFNSDFTHVKLKLVKEEYLKSEDGGLFSIAILAITTSYQQFAGVKDDDIKLKIDYIDVNTNKTFKNYNLEDYK